MTVNEVYENNLRHFKIKKRYGDKSQCQCPAHDDKHASLTITKGRKCTLFYCHAGCTVDEVLNAAGLEKKDTFYDVEPRSPNWKAYVEAREKRKIETIYNYVSIDGSYAFTKIRLEGKKIIYGKLQNDRFTYGLGHKENTRWSNEQEFKFGTVEQPERRVLSADELPNLFLKDKDNIPSLPELLEQKEREKLPQLGIESDDGEGENEF